MPTTYKLYANTGLATISVANSKLDGTGTLATVLTAGHSGTEIYSLIIKAQGNTSEGMVRFFITGTNGVITLYREVQIPASVQSPVVSALQIKLDERISLNPGFMLSASTQNGDTFNIIAYSDEWSQCGCGESCCAAPKKIANTGVTNIAVANSFLDGTGALGTVLVAISANTDNGGTQIDRVNIKATGSTSQGMVRLFVFNGVTNFLIAEIPIPASVQTGIQPAFRTEYNLDLCINPSYVLKASTQNADTFVIVAEGTNLINCPCLS